MAKIGRNEACPCGSGRKYKRCCIEREAELVRQDEAAEELLTLGTLFPLLRPSGPELDEWAAHVTEITRDVVEEGIARLSASERERIARGHAERYPEAWTNLVADFGDETVAQRLVVIGAVAAFLHERRQLDAATLEHLEECPDCGSDAVETLAAVVESCDLWSVVEASELEEAIADGERINAALASLVSVGWTREHAHRLELLVSRVCVQLPVAERPAASALLLKACALFERDAAFRERVAQRLLADTLTPLRLLRLAA